MSIPKFHVDEVAIVQPIVGGVDDLAPDVYGQECTILQLPRDRTYKRVIRGEVVLYHIPNAYLVELKSGGRLGLQEGYLRKRFERGQWSACAFRPAEKVTKPG